MIRTAECVSPMHPDKLCDRISDSLLDLYLKGDPNSRCAIETAGGYSKVFITGEVTSKTEITDKQIKSVVKELTGITDVIIHLNKQSPEIANGVDTGGAGDQGIMIGYACRENKDNVPMEYFLARKLNKFVFKKFPFDGKTQVTIQNTYGGDDYVSVVCSFQNAPEIELEDLVNEFFKKYPTIHLDNLYCNPAGDWNIGGFQADSGVTGRKIVVDNYGPRIPIGGGAFSGKDATKVDRSAAYMARRIAVDYLEKYTEVNDVTVQLSYAIGYEQPIQATVMFDGNPETQIHITEYDLTPRGIIQFLELHKPIYGETAKWGHMGNKFNWK